MIDVRTIGEDDVPAYVAAMATGFHQHVEDGESEWRRPQLDHDRTYGAFDGSLMIGTARSFATQLTLPGGAMLPVAAVTNVTVTGTHRRRGVLRAMMAAQLEEIANRGEAAAILIASEAPIYGRYGYGPATEHVLLEVDLTVGRLVADPPAGSVRLSTVAEMRQEAPVVYERYRRAQPGAIGRRPGFWDVHYGVTPRPGNKAPAEAFFALYRDRRGVVEGYVAYRIKSHWDYRIPLGVVEIDELVTTTDEAYAALWRHCTGLDLIKKVTAENRPPLEPLPWMMSDRRAVRQRDRADLVWVRLLDLPAALAGRRYRFEDRLVIGVRDPFRAGPTAALMLESGAEAVTCRPTDEAPEVSVDVADLGASYLGGTPLWPAAAAGRVVEHRPGAVAAFDRLFLTDVLPWCNTWF